MKFESEEKLFTQNKNHILTEIDEVECIVGHAVSQWYEGYESGWHSLIIQVKDSGKGIPKEDLDKIFEPLFTTKQIGTGLGLASVKSIIGYHGGVISVTSPPTIFTITLPKKSD